MSLYLYLVIYLTFTFTRLYALTRSPKCLQTFPPPLPPYMPMPKKAPIRQRASFNLSHRSSSSLPPIL